MIKALGTVVIETPRLLARLFREEDVPQVYTNWTSDTKVTPYVTWAVHEDISMTEDYIKAVVDSYQDPSSYRWAIEVKATGQLIGDISVINTDKKVASAELGWVIGSAWWGQGYMTEIAGAVLAFLLNEAEFNRVTASHASQNKASGRVMQKIGMTYEGCHRQAGRVNQGLVDVQVYAKLKSDLT